MQQRRGIEFAELVHRALVIDKQWTVAQVAHGMGMSYDTFYGRLVGRVAFSPDEVTALIRAAPDVRFPDQILQGTQFVAIPRKSEDDVNVEKQIMDSAVNSVHAVSEVLKQTNKALADNRLDHREQARIRVELDSAERELATLRNLLEPG